MYLDDGEYNYTGRKDTINYELFKEQKIGKINEKYKRNSASRNDYK